MPRASSAVLACGLWLAGCASFSVLSPGKNATVPSPAPTDVYWNADLNPGTLKVQVDATDVTAQLTVTDTHANGHAVGSVALSQGSHVLQVSGDLWDGNAFQTQTTSQSFQVSNGPGRPVTYTLTVFNVAPGWPAGTLGTLTFGGTGPHPNVNLIFTFEGNTADVVSFHVPATSTSVGDGDGFEIIAGTASVSVIDATTGSVLQSAQFIPAARIFVSVDNGNRGIGFGSFGALPNDPSFPTGGVEVIYPYGLFMAPYTDLQSNYSYGTPGSWGYSYWPDWALSCTGFNGSPGTPGPGNCNQPPSLGTTAGLLTILSNGGQDLSPSGVVAGSFTTVVH
jgi:hypothetical protein